MSAEIKKGDPVSGASFLRILEQSMGGPLYYGVHPQYERKLVDISPSMSRGLSVVENWIIANNRGVTLPRRTGNVAGDFMTIMVSTSPHPEEARNNIHLLADPFCRGYMDEGLEHFMEETGRINVGAGNFVVQDKLPLKLTDLYSFILDIPERFGTLNEYIDFARDKAGLYSNQLEELADDKKAIFQMEYQKAMDRCKIYSTLNMDNRTGELHPMIQIMIGYLTAAYLLKDK